MPELPAHMSLETLRAAAVVAHPELAGARFSILADGWDSVALDVDDRLIVKFPRHALGEAGLRREAEVLGIVRPAVTLPVPDLALFEEPVPHTMHPKLAGTSLEPSIYAELPEAVRAELGETLGLFYAQLHAIDPEHFRAAGAGPADMWLHAAAIRDRAFPLLPAALHGWAEKALNLWADLPPDPYGDIYGFFDGHGWNMAFDRKARKLNGIFDFGDSGFGPLHREFVYSNLVSPDLTARIVSAYERHSGRALDRQRILLLSDVHHLWEIAMEHDDPASVALMLRAAAEWIAIRA